MDTLTVTLISVGILLLIPVLIFLIIMCVVAIMYEGIFGRRYEIYETPLLPDAADYPDLIAQSVTFPSEKKYSYTGCYYYNKNYKEFKALIVFAHGIFDGHLSYLPQIAYFAERGYKIFAYDNTGSHMSGGKNLRGLPQSAIDLSAALRYIQTDLPILLFGHSWGGYAVSAVSLYGDFKIKGIFVQSGFNRTTDMLLDEGAKMYGRFVYMLSPYIKLYERIKFGKRSRYTAEQGIKRAEANGAKIMILHSVDDDVISLKNSVLSNVTKTPNISFISAKNKGHNSMNSDDSIRHKADLENHFIEEYHGSGTRAQRVSFYAENGDKHLYHELDGELMAKAAEFFDSAVRGKKSK